MNLLDSNTQDIKQYFDETGKFINDAINKKEGVLVHCHAGISRSSSVILAYLIKYLKMNLDKALTFMKSKRDKINPNSGFIKQLELYQKDNNIL